MDKNTEETTPKNNENIERKKNIQNTIKSENKGKMSTGSKVAVGVIGCGGLLVIGVIGVIALAFFFAFLSNFEEEETVVLYDEVTEDTGELGGIGDSLIIDNLQYTLLGYSVQDSIGEGFSKEEASEGSKLVVVELEVENIGSEEAYISASILNLIDKDNIPYTAFFHFGEDSLSLNSLQPQTKQKGTVLFEVPELTATEYLNLNIAKSSWVEEEIHQFAIDLRE